METAYLDIPRIYTAIAEWAACMVYICILRKSVKPKAMIISIVFFMIQTTYLTVTANAPVFLWIPCMLGAVALMFLFLKSCKGLSFVETGFYCAKAFLLAEFAASLEWQLHTFLFDVAKTNWFLQQGFFLVSYAILFICAWVLEKHLIKQEYFVRIQWKELLVVLGIVVIVFAFSNLSFIRSGLPFTSSLPREIFNIRTLVDLGGLATLYAFQSRIGEYIADRELTAIQNVLRTQYEQYRNYQTNIEMMNIKYHDLKHQIAGLKAETNWEKRIEWLNTMEQEIDSCHHQAYQTGNRVLDTILESKMYQCKKNKIQFTCVADGKLLENIHVVDICTIFGNAMDNAIESVVMESDEEKRLIHLTISAVKNFIYIKIENYCKNPLKLEKGELPKTSKKDGSNHGYGLKSIQYTVEKNGGTCNLKMKNNWFELVILLPK